MNFILIYIDLYNNNGKNNGYKNNGYIWRCTKFENTEQCVVYIIYIYIYIESKLLCRMKILKTMKNESLLCFCATRFTAVAALQA